MSRPLSRSDVLMTSTHEACLITETAALGGQLRRRDVLRAIEQAVPMDGWAMDGLESSAVPRWRKDLRLLVGLQLPAQTPGWQFLSRRLKKRGEAPPTTT